MKKGKKWKKILIILAIIVLVVVVALVVVFKFVLSKKTDFPVKQSTSTVSLEKMDLVNSISATGTISSQKSKEVTATINNVEVKSVEVSVGDTVEKGQKLVVFDESDLQEAYNEALENLADVKASSNKSISKAKKQLSSAESDYSEAKKEKSEAVEDAKEEYDSAKSKVKSLKSKAKKDPQNQEIAQQLEQAEQALTQAEKAYEQAKSEQKQTNKQNQSSIDNAKEAIETANDNYSKNVKEAQKKVDSAKENLDACAILAPMSGTVTAINVEDGDTYSGSSLMTIEDLSSFTVTTSVDEYDISKVEVGQKVIIKTEATDDEEIEGEISFVALTNQSSTTSSAGMGGSGSSSSSSGYEVKINLKSTNEKLRLGMTAKCSIILEEAADVYAVPYDAIHTAKDGSFYINVLEVSASTGNDTNSRETSVSSNIKKITVSKGLESDYYVEITGSDLADGMKVIVDTDVVSSQSSSSDEMPSFGDFGGDGGFSGGPGGGFSGGPSGGFSGGPGK